MNTEQVKMLIIDDNPMIYDDFKKILIIDQESTRTKSQLDQLTAELFGDDDNTEQVSKKFNDVDFPVFMIDYANQGELGFKAVNDNLG